MLEKMKKKWSQQIFRQNSANLWLIMMIAVSISLGCSYFKAKTETVVTTKQMTLAEVKNSRDLVSVMKTHDTVPSKISYVLTKAINEEQPLKSDGEIAEVTTQYWSGLETIDMVVLKFSSPDKATSYFDGEESKRESNYPVRGKKANGDPTLFFTDGKGTVTFITCKKDFCYNFSKKAKLLTEMVASADFFADYDKKYLSSNN